MRNEYSFRKENAMTLKQCRFLSFAAACILLLLVSNLQAQTAEGFFNRGSDAYDRANYDQAIAYYTKAIQLNSHDADTYFNRGLAYYSKGNYDEAIADYTIAAALKPKDPDTYYNRGMAYDDKGNYD